MPAGPWYISARAVQDYLAIMRRQAVTEGPIWDEAERELIDLATAAATREPKPYNDGALQYRGGRPLRLRFIVTHARRKEGDLPQLVRVLPDNDGRRTGDRL